MTTQASPSPSSAIRSFARCCLLASLPAGSMLWHGAALAQAIDLSHGGQIAVTALGGFDWDQNLKKVVAYDQAKAVRNNATVTADKLIAYYRKKQPAGATTTEQAAPPPAVQPGHPTPDPAPSTTTATPPGTTAPAATATTGDGKTADDQDSGSNEIYRLEAIGHVHIFTDTDQAWGDKAVYDMDKAVLIMTGKNLRLTTPQDVLTARDSMEYYSQQHISIGRGDATVTTDDHRQIRADVLVGYSSQVDTPKTETSGQNKTGTSDDPLASGSNKLEKVNAFGHVWVRTQTEIVTGDRGVYVPDSGIARIVGNVHITRGPNQIQGAAAIINMHTGIATMTERPGGRVSGLIVPNNGDSSDRK
ncbi:LptA/OstA family protein [Acetobacter lovaniensis]|jgi:lipopolysaccharide export system protein LptA|uniref:LptA/OstA family protein n=3 Tax=Acetobacter TaxID=434 RepID=UPI0037705DB2